VNEAERIALNAEMAAAEQRAREAAAQKAGHPEWAQLPATAGWAKHLKQRLYFTGKRCEEGHVSPRVMRTRACVACQEGRGPGRPRLHPVDDRTVWEQRFDSAAQKIRDTGRLHHVMGNGQFRATSVVVEGDPGPACQKAAQKTDRTGRLHCVIWRGGKFVVREVAPAGSYTRKRV
jgi:hypothetical protein